MSMKNVGFVGIGVAAGFIGASIFLLVNDSRRPHELPVALPPAASSFASMGIPPSRPQSQRGTPEPAVPARTARTPEEIRQLAHRVLQALAPPSPEAVREADEQREAAQLLASGLTQERFDWIMLRREELVARQATQAPSNPQRAHYQPDPDIGLRELIGAEEYSKFRVATGRLTTVGVPEVVPGSAAELAGLKAGDEIVSYGGRRVFNLQDLDNVAADNTSRGSVSVEVKRDGHTFRIAMPAGPPGLRVETVEEMMARWGRSSSAASAVQ
jgi:hypothetical protein